MSAPFFGSKRNFRQLVQYEQSARSKICYV